jgi:hypothetical protein
VFDNKEVTDVFEPFHTRKNEPNSVRLRGSRRRNVKVFTGNCPQIVGYERTHEKEEFSRKQAHPGVLFARRVDYDWV